jgi:thioredoxin-like negative regulator of GroEL
MSDTSVDKVTVLVEQLADFRKRVIKVAELEARLAKAPGDTELAAKLEETRVSDAELRTAIERLRKLRDKTAPAAKEKAVKKATSKVSNADALGLLGDFL